MNINQYEKLIEVTQSELNSRIEKFVEELNSFCYNGIKANFRLNYDGCNIKLHHETLNWTDFVTVYFEKRYSSKNYKFSFNHGSGGWNDGDVDDILQATIDMFSIVKEFKVFLEDNAYRITEFNKDQSALHDLYDELNNLKDQQEIEKQDKELSEKYKRISKNNLFELLNKSKVLKCKQSNSRGISDIEISDNGNKRVSLSYGNSPVSKKWLFDLLDRKPIYLIEEV